MLDYAEYGFLTSEEVGQAAEEGYTLVLPVGAIEQHGYHLPIDTDDYLAQRAVREGVAEARRVYGARVLSLPAVHYGNSFAHLGFPGRISLGFGTFISMICDILNQLVGQGFRQFVIVNGNGGNEAGLTIAMREVTERWTERGIRVLIYRIGAGGIESAPMPQGFSKRIGEILPPNVRGTHAGAQETSWSLSGREHLVRQDRLIRPKTEPVSWANFTMKDISNTGANGDPTQASEKAGDLYWETYRASFAKMLAEIANGHLPTGLDPDQ